MFLKVTNTRDNKKLPSNAILLYHNAARKEETRRTQQLNVPLFHTKNEAL